jgi:hypothetical protein
MEMPGAAVGRIRVPFDESPRLKLVEDAAERDRLDFKKLHEARLINALVLRQVSRNVPLRPSEPGSTGILFQPLFQ